MKKGSSSSPISSKPDKSRPESPKLDETKWRKCECCGKILHNTKAYRDHQLIHRGSRGAAAGVEEKVDKNLVTCKVCEKTFHVHLFHHYCPSPPPSSSSDEDEDEDTKRKRLVCSICGDTFKTIRSFAYHQRYCLPRGEDEEDVVDEPWLDGERLEYFSRRFAEAALLYLKNNGPKEYKLVKPGPYQKASISLGPMIHFNFKAKPKDCPDAEILTFFGQLRMYPHGDPYVVDCCVSLGSDVPHFTEAQTYDCTYCQCGVHHPGPDVHCPKLITGVNRKEASWLYGSSDSSSSDDGGDQ